MLRKKQSGIKKTNAYLHKSTVDRLIVGKNKNCRRKRSQKTINSIHAVNGTMILWLWMVVERMKLMLVLKLIKYLTTWTVTLLWFKREFSSEFFFSTKQSSSTRIHSTEETLIDKRFYTFHSSFDLDLGMDFQQPFRGFKDLIIFQI